MKLLTTLQGYKTYILVLVAFVLWLGMVFNWWTMEQVDKLFGLLTILGIGAFRSTLKKLE